MVSKSASSFLDFDRFFLVRTTGSTRLFRGKIQATVDQADAFTRGELIPKKPVVVTYHMGGAPKDVLWTTSGSPLIFHDRIVERFVAQGFTGWATYPVVIHDKSGNILSSYSGISFTGRCGPIDDTRSEVVLRDYPGGRFPVLKGLYFEPGSWDGCDFFMSSDGNLFQFVTEAVKTCLNRAKVTEINLVKLTEVEQPTGWERRSG